MNILWDIKHLVRDFGLTLAVGLVVLLVFLLLPSAAVVAVLAVLFQMYAAGWWEAANCSARWQYGKTGWPWEWRGSEWGDMASSFVGALPAGVIVYFVADFIIRIFI